LVVNALSDNAYLEVRNEAIAAAGILGGEGYPQHWTNDTVIRAGLRADDRLSLRKAKELARVQPQQLRQALRTTDDVYVYVTNQTNGTVPVFGACGIGMTTVISAPANATMTAVAISSSSQASLPVSGALNITVEQPDSAYTNLTQNDVLVIEGGFAQNTSVAQALLYFEAASQRGITIFVIGDPGIPVFGLRVNYTNVTNITVQQDAGAELGFAANDNVLLASNTSVPTIEPPDGTAATDYRVVGVADTDKTAYATWLYNDARVWYIAYPYGNVTTRPGTNVTSLLINSTSNAINVPWPSCGGFTAPPSKQLAVFTRTLPWHDQLLTLNVMMWRNR